MDDAGGRVGGFDLVGMDAVEKGALRLRPIGVRSARGGLALGVPAFAGGDAGLAADAGVEVDDEAELDGGRGGRVVMVRALRWRRGRGAARPAPPLAPPRGMLRDGRPEGRRPARAPFLTACVFAAKNTLGGPRGAKPPLPEDDRGSSADLPGKAVGRGGDRGGEDRVGGSLIAGGRISRPGRGGRTRRPGRDRVRVGGPVPSGRVSVSGIR